MSEEWNEKELRLAILQLLLGARKRNPQAGGLLFNELRDCVIPKPNVGQLQKEIRWLCGQDLVEAGKQAFLITATGVDYVETPPPDPPANSPDSPRPDAPPWSPGDPPGPWPPKNGPDDPSRVPLRRKPSGGDNKMAVPLPDPDGLHAN